VGSGDLGCSLVRARGGWPRDDARDRLQHCSAKNGKLRIEQRDAVKKAYAFGRIGCSVMTGAGGMALPAGGYIKAQLADDATASDDGASRLCPAPVG